MPTTDDRSCEDAARSTLKQKATWLEPLILDVLPELASEGPGSSTSFTRMAMASSGRSPQ
ncbi:hypothetical protein ADK57_17030 [Streptomyces sp. MMG1533]|nr:hypothetical protein ADK57_17030 [Streptomyces sp. MMG1533]